MDRFRTAIPAAVLSLCLSCGGDGLPDVTVSDDVSTGTECLSSSQCDDGLPCTVDRCARGWCFNESMVCDDGDDCTIDSCVAGACRFDRIQNCCETDADCDDGDPCTKNDRCSLEKQCVIAAPVSPCCRSDAECDDGDVCTVDTCQVNLLCGHVWKEQPNLCCNEDRDCSDSDACTRDTCVMSDAIHGRCDHEILCCDLDSECVDAANVCMDGVCEVPDGGTRKECSYVWADGCCLSVDDCEPVDCMDASCSGNDCSWDRIPGCCTSDADCPDPEGCLQCSRGDDPTGVCVRKGISGCCNASVFDEPFAASDGWVFQTPSQYMADASAYSDAAVWHLSDERARSTTMSLAFFDQATGSCRVAGRKSGGRAVSPQIPLMMTNGPSLSFWMWKFTDDIQSTKDVVSVYVKASDGSVVKVFSTANQGTFHTGSTPESAVFMQFPAGGPIDLSAWSDQSVQLVFEYDSATASFVDDYAVFVDDITVSGTCE